MDQANILKILFVDDLPTDTDLAVWELKKSGIPFKAIRVDTKAAFLKALWEFNPDIVISDYALPEFDGMQALKSALEYNSFLPFIILTGSMNEDTAVLCMKAGATDYVIKEHMTRLPFAVKEALAQKELQKKKEAAEDALRKSENKYRGIFENIQDVYFETSLSGVILEVSPSIEILSGGQYHREDWIGRAIGEFYVKPGSGDDLLPVLDKYKTVFDFEVLFKNIDGSLIPCSLSSKIQYNSSSDPEKIIGTIRDISQRKQVESLLAHRARELTVIQEATISSMAILAEYRDPETGGHIQRTKLYVKLLLEKSRNCPSFTQDHLELIWRSAPLHDIGKLGIPDGILLKPGKLTAEEFEQMKKHTLLGGQAIRRTKEFFGEESFLNFAQEIAEYHHEKWNGTGYPHGLKGDEIPFCARIMAIADVYDALVTSRPYKEPIEHEKAVEIIHKDSGIHFDPLLVRTFKENHREFDKIAKQNRE